MTWPTCLRGRAMTGVKSRSRERSLPFQQHMAVFSGMGIPGRAWACSLGQSCAAVWQNTSAWFPAPQDSRRTLRALIVPVRNNYLGVSQKYQCVCAPVVTVCRTAGTTSSAQTFSFCLLFLSPLPLKLPVLGPRSFFCSLSLFFSSLLFSPIAPFSPSGLLLKCWSSFRSFSCANYTACRRSSAMLLRCYEYATTSSHVISLRTVCRLVFMYG